MSRDDNTLNGAPIWLKAASILGIPGVIALYLVYYVTSSSAADHKIIMQQHERSNAFLAQICRNTARGDKQALNCDQIEQGFNAAR